MKRKHATIPIPEDKKLWPTAPKKIINLDTNVVYNSFIEAARANDISTKSLRDTCKGIQKTSAGYHWMYYDEYLKKQENEQ